MQMTRFNIGKDINGVAAYDLPDSNTKFQTILTASVEQTLTVPQTNDPIYPRVAVILSVEPGTSMWYSLNSTAELPTSSFTQTTSEHNPQVRIVQPGDVLHFITRSLASELGVVMYASQ